MHVAILRQTAEYLLGTATLRGKVKSQHQERGDYLFKYGDISGNIMTVSKPTDIVLQSFESKRVV